MLHIARGLAVRAKPGCERSWPRDPVLEVRCPDCAAPIGVRCRRPSGHSGPFVGLHASRDLLADRQGAYGACPLGTCGLQEPARQAALPF
ncbi:zinc finger domain-containing protein [Sphingomonas sp. TX0522]|uniref:zinc finger domain-containing protein n=1 Tax=Sphingomonas sp. TX0522 TaxID=2479205 RepID=UPI003FA7BF6A